MKLRFFFPFWLGLVSYGGPPSAMPSAFHPKRQVMGSSPRINSLQKGVFFGGGGGVKTISNHLSQILQNWKLCALGIIFFGLLSYTCIRWALNSQPHSPCFQGE